MVEDRPQALAGWDLDPEPVRLALDEGVLTAGGQEGRGLGVVVGLVAIVAAALELEGDHFGQVAEGLATRAQAVFPALCVALGQALQAQLAVGDAVAVGVGADQEGPLP